MSTAYTLSNPFPLTGNTIVDVTTNGYKWYFPVGTPRVLNWSVSSSLWSYPILQSTETQADFTRAFGNIAEFINVQFKFLGYVSGTSGLTGYENAYLSGSDLNITYGYNGTNSSGAKISDGKFTTSSQTAFAYFPDLKSDSKYLGAAGDTFLNYNNSFTANATFENGTSSFALLLHEVLHGLGLKHPHDSGGTGRPTYTSLGIKFSDRQWISVMSYDLYENGGDGAYSGSQPIGPMLFDAIALQYLYGESSFNSGSTTYDLNLYVGDYYNCQWDASGTDLLDAANLTYGVFIDLDGGQLSNGSNTHHVGYITSITDYVAMSLKNPTKWTWLWGEYENVNGSPYADVITGNDLDNVINGGSGNDYLTGGSGNDTFDWDSSLREGNDTLVGGLGNDIYVLNSVGDSVQEFGGEGVDTVFVGFNYSILNTSIENIKTFTNQTQPVTFTGNSWTNILDGGAGNDYLYGNSGNDTLTGGLGNDFIDGGTDTDYVFYSSSLSELIFTKNGSDVVVYSKNEGVDTLRNVEYVRNNGINYSLSNILSSTEPAYFLSSVALSVNEGSSAQFLFVTTNVVAGTQLAYSISGISTQDLKSGSLTGLVTVTSTGTTTISIPISSDGVTEGAEAITLTVQGKSASVLINDSSTEDNTVMVFDTDVFGKVLTNSAKRYSGTKGNDSISGAAGGDLIYGNNGNDSIYGLAGDDLISGLDGNDYLSGGDGDDRLFGSIGDDIIYGGKGSDTAIYEGDYSNFSVTVLYNSKNAVSGYKVVDKTGKEGSDTIQTDVEFLDFNYGKTIVTLDKGKITTKSTNNTSAGIVKIAGEAKQGEVLTASTAAIDLYGVSEVGYYWKVSADNKSWVDLSTGSSFQLTESEVGKYIVAYATFVDVNGIAISGSSYVTNPVLNINDAPIGSIEINGIFRIGEKLSAASSLFDADGLGAITYSWQSSTDGFSWSTFTFGDTVTLLDSLAGKYIRAVANYVDGRGTTEIFASNKSETLAVDVIAPNIAISSNKSSLMAGDTATVTFTLSEATSNFTSSDIYVSGGTISNFIGNGATYTVTFTPTPNSTADGVLSVASGVFSDASGNINVDGSDLNNIVTFAIDNVAPTISLSSSKSSLIAGDTAMLSFILSEVSSNFTASDIAVSGGTISNFSGSGTTYTAEFTPATNSILFGLVAVASGVFNDTFGNANLDGADTNNTLSLAIDTVAPTIALSTNKLSLIAGDTATLTFTLSESSSNFTASDITVTGGALSSFSGSGSIYTVMFTPAANSNNNALVSVLRGVFSDLAGNTNAGGPESNSTVNIVIDTQTPTISVSSNKPSLYGGDSAILTFTLSETSSNFTAADITVTGGTLSNFAGAGSLYTANFTLMSNSFVDGLINVSDGVFTDVAGNKNADGADTNNFLKLSRIPSITTEVNTLSVIVDKNVLSTSAALLKDLKESITFTNGVKTKHVVEFENLTFDYNQIDALIMTVTRNDEFTSEFTKEINDYLKTDANIAYKVAVGLVGAANIDGVIMMVAGSDGSYVS
jgi:Ca2+-binding RTX toxin-like protein